MAPAEFSLRLQKGKQIVRTLSTCTFTNLAVCTGITGGFAPPTPSAILTITGTPTTSLHVTSAIRPDGTPSLQDAAPKSLSATDPETVKLLDELYAILKSIPTESPPGSEDIYGLDTSIAFGSEDLMWMNGGPQGCGGGHSTVQATAEDKAKFRRAVEIVEKLVGEAQ